LNKYENVKRIKLHSTSAHGGFIFNFFLWANNFLPRVFVDFTTMLCETCHLAVISSFVNGDYRKNTPMVISYLLIYGFQEKKRKNGI